MKKIYLVGLAGMALAISVFLFGASVKASTSLFSDSFESGNFNSWTASSLPWIVQGTTAHTGVKRATAIGPGIGSVTKQQSTENFESITLSYWYRIQASLETGDHVFVDWSADGITWNQIADHTGPATGSFQFASYSIPEATNLTDFQFRFYASLSNSSDVFWLDDVELVGEAMATPTLTPTDEPTPTPTATPEPTIEPTPTETPEPTPTPTPTPEPTPEPTPTLEAPLDPDPILENKNKANENALLHILRNITRWFEKHL